MCTIFRTFILVMNNTGSHHSFEKKNGIVRKSPLAAVWQIDYIGMNGQTGKSVGNHFTNIPAKGCW